MTQFVVTQTFFERGGARYCGSSVMTIAPTLEVAKKRVEDHVQMSRDTMDWADEPVKWKWDQDAKVWTTVDFEACSDFAQFQVEAVEA